MFSKNITLQLKVVEVLVCMRFKMRENQKKALY
jgi:hypothetical protein